MKRYISFITSLLLLSFVWTSCKKDDPTLGIAPTPEQVKFSIIPDVSNPNIINFKSDATGFLAKWDLGNGTKVDGALVQGAYAVKGQYTVTLTIFTNGGFASTSKVITIANTNPLMLNREDYNFLTGGASKLTGKTWVVDKELGGHLGVGPTAGTTPEWYSAAANEKASEGFYDDEMTFKLEGFSYAYANQGGTFANAAHLGTLGGSGSGDQTVAYTPKTGMTWTIVDKDGKKYLSISDGGFIGYYTGVSQYEIITLNENELYLRFSDSKNEALAWYQRLVPKGFTRPKVIKPYKVEDIADNFDENGNVVWKLDNLQFNDNYDNPAPVPVNTSAKVGLYRKQAGAAFEFANLFNNLAYKMDLTQRNVFKLKVYMPSYNDYTTEAGEDWANKKLLQQVSVKLQDSEAAQPWANQVEVKQQVAQLDKWVELTFDFSGAVSRKDLDRIVVQIGGEGNFNPGIFFIDDFKLQ